MVGVSYTLDCGKMIFKRLDKILFEQMKRMRWVKTYQINVFELNANKRKQ